MRSMLVVFFVFVTQTIYCQDILVRTYGGVLNEVAYDIIETSDKGYFLLGSTGSIENENSDIYLVKIDSLLNFEWSKTYGSEFVDWGESIVETDDGNYIILGNTSSENNYNIIIYKIDLEGEILWSENYGGSNWDFGHSIIKNHFGGYLIGGETFSQGEGDNDALIIAIDENGQEIWYSTYGGEGSEVCNSIAQDQDGNTFFIGNSSSENDTSRLFLVRIDVTNNGDSIWSLNYGNVESYGHFLKTHDSSIIVVGKRIDISTKQLIAKFNYEGESQWAQTSGADSNQELNAFTINSQNEIVSVGTGDTYGQGGNDVIVYRRSIASGDVIIGITYGREFDDYGVKIINTSSNKLMALAKLNKYVNPNMDFGILAFPTDTSIAGIPFIEESFIDQTLSVNAIESKNNHNLIKYISDDRIELTFTKTMIGGQIILTTTNGKTIYNETIKNTVLSVKIGNLPAGTYNLTFLDRSKKISQNLIIK